MSVPPVWRVFFFPETGCVRELRMSFPKKGKKSGLFMVRSFPLENAFKKLCCLGHWVF